MADETWTIRRCVDWTVEYLAGRGMEHPRVSAEWLMGAATGYDRVDIYSNYDQPLSPEELAFMHDAVVRRVKGEPLQYIVGEAPFRSLTVACEPGVLIPRPETEMLVELVLDRLGKTIPCMGKPERKRVELPWNAEVQRIADAERAAAEAERSARATSEGGDLIEAAASESFPSETASTVGVSAEEGRVESGVPTEDPATTVSLPAVRILEVGCGTGCISLSLATERPGRVRCVATDISERAVSLAERNRAACGVDAATVDIRLGDLVSPVSPDEEGSFDALVSNPPYIPSAVMATLPAEVGMHEPHLALDGGEDGLDVFRRLLDVAPRMLKPGGLFACELFEDALNAAASLCRHAGMDHVEIMPDLTGRSRFVLARIPQRL